MPAGYDEHKELENFLSQTTEIQKAGNDNMQKEVAKKENFGNIMSPEQLSTSSAIRREIENLLSDNTEKSSSEKSFGSPTTNKPECHVMTDTPKTMIRSPNEMPMVASQQQQPRQPMTTEQHQQFNMIGVKSPPIMETTNVNSGLIDKIANSRVLTPTNVRLTDIALPRQNINFTNHNNVATAVPIKKNLLHPETSESNGKSGHEMKFDPRSPYTNSIVSPPTPTKTQVIQSHYYH